MIPVPDWARPWAAEAEQARERRRAGALRNRAHRWGDKHPTTLVSAAGHSPVEVPHPSRFGAILCAAELWGVKFYDLKDVKVGRELNSK